MHNMFWLNESVYIFTQNPNTNARWTCILKTSTRVVHTHSFEAHVDSVARHDAKIIHQSNNIVCVSIFFHAINTFAQIRWKLKYFLELRAHFLRSPNSCIKPWCAAHSPLSYICRLNSLSVHLQCIPREHVNDMQANCAANNLNQQNNMNHCTSYTTISRCLFLVLFIFSRFVFD